jgi:hypothetical protein
MHMNRFSRASTSLSAALRGVAIVTTVLLARPVLAQGYLGEDQALIAKYRCAVLGDTAQCVFNAEKVSPRLEERVVLGPRAKYLVYLGVDPVKAVADARRSGEVPVRETVRITTRTLSSAETYDRVNGRTVAPAQFTEVLSAMPILTDTEAVALR